MPVDIEPQLTKAEKVEKRRGVFRRLMSDPFALVSLLLLLVIVVVGLLAPWIMPHNPATVNLSLVDAPPGGSYLLGGDGTGRDVLSRLIASINVSVESAVIATGVALIIGVSAGLAAGYFERWFDWLGSWVANMIMALPGVILLIALYPITGGSTQIQMVILGVLIAPGIFRLVRNMVISVKHELYVDAARVSGLSNIRILGRHILYVVRAPLIIQAAFIAGVAISIQAGLAFIGIGNTTTPSWGQMLADGFSTLYTAPLLVLWPGLMLGITSICLILLGNAMRDVLEGTPKTSRPRKNEKLSVTSAAAAAAHTTTALLSVQNLDVGYPSRDGVVTVVNGVSLEVAAGEILGLVGESGSGKTQTAFSILGLLPAEAIVAGGSIRLNNEELFRLTPVQMDKRRGTGLAYIPQEPMSNLDPSFTIGSQMSYGIMAVTKLSKSAARLRTIELFERVGIADPDKVIKLYPHEISGGMAQRVLIAAAVACDPQLLIADEPTTALDVTIQAEVLDLLRDLQRERQMGVILVTHNFGVVADLCDRVAVMHNGTIVETGAVRDIFEHPQHEYTKMLLASILEETPFRAPLDDQQRRRATGAVLS
jgi:peptide/nickel transport system permease protein